MKRFLITTADERTWRRDRPVLFLGEWCRLYARRSAWQGLDAEVVPYHWDDRQQYDADCDRIRSLYEELLAATAAALNEHHGVDRSARYWRILIGPWLNMFTHVIFDRWTMVQKASDAYQIEGTWLLHSSPASMIAPDFMGAVNHDLAWTQHLFGRAIEFQNRIPWQRVPASDAPPPADVRPVPANVRRPASTALKALVSSFLERFTRSDEVMIMRSYLPTMEELKLHIALGQVPKLWTPPRVRASPPDMARRGKLRIAAGATDPFRQFAASMVAELIPTAFVEGYASLRKQADSLPWPSRPKAIFTAISFQFSEVFQEWMAAKSEAGSPLVVGQHGGFIGIGRRVSGEDHQVGIADRFLTWGWQDQRPQTRPAVTLTNVNKPIATWKRSGNLLLVTMPIRLFTFRSMSWPVGANQSACFAGEQLRFIEGVGERIRASLTFRIDRAVDSKIGTSYVERVNDAFPGVTIDPSTEPIEGALRQCRLFVYTYNSTGFLETLGRDIPTVVFWNPRYFELRASVQPLFDLLAEAGIYHPTPEAAAQHVRLIWDDVDAWWYQPAVQHARRTFSERFACMPAHPLRVLRDALLTVPAPVKRDALV